MRFHILSLLLLQLQLTNCEKNSEQWLTEANSFLSQGQFTDALEAYNNAIELDPKNYLSYFKRATALVTLGRNQQAIDDFSSILDIKPDFNQAYLQRGKIYAKKGEFELAIKDLKQFLSTNEQHQDTIELLGKVNEASQLISVGEKQLQNREFKSAGETFSFLLMVAPQALELRKKRAYSAISQNLYEEAIGDWTRVIQLSPLDQETLQKLALINYYIMYDFDAAIKNVKKILHYDPDSKKFKALFKQIKKSEKQMTNLQTLYKKKDWKEINEILDNDNNNGLLISIEAKLKEIVNEIGATDFGPNQLMGKLYIYNCIANQRLKNKGKSIDSCTKAIELQPESSIPLVARSEVYILMEKYEEAIQDLKKANEIKEGDKKIKEKLRNAQIKLKQSKQKDYYKILQVSRNAGQKEIKKAFLKLARKWHPDTYRGDLPKEEVEKKMAELNQAYEVLSNEELKARFDQGDDPNDPTGGHGHNENPFGGHGHPFSGGDPFQFFFQKGGHGSHQGGGFEHQFHFGF